MILAITIALFLGTAIAVFFVFVIFSQKEHIREALKEQRIEPRTPATVGLELHSLEESLAEVAFTENVSRHGARVLTKNRWRPHARVLVRLPHGEEGSRAKIAYCDALPGNVFATGLRFAAGVDMGDFRPRVLDPSKL